MTSRLPAPNLPAVVALALTLSSLSLLVLAAHFLRGGQVVACAAALGVLGALLLVRRRWVLRGTQAVLALAVVVWASTAWRLIQQRQAEGGSSARLAVILGAVIVLNMLAALLLGTRRLAGRYAASPGDGTIPD